MSLQKKVLPLTIACFVAAASGAFAAGAPGNEALPTGGDEIAAARAAVSGQPASAPAHARLGYLLADSGALDEAMAQFDQALAINPRAYDAKTGRGVVLVKMGKLQEAEAVLKSALVLNPNPVRTHYELGRLYQQKGDYAQALSHFKEGIKKHEQGRI